MTRMVTLRRFYRECRESLSQIYFNRPPMDLDHSRFRTKTWDPKLTCWIRCTPQMNVFLKWSQQKLGGHDYKKEPFTFKS